MTPEERKALLRAFKPLTAHEPGGQGPEPLCTFLPTLGNRRALYGETVVVLGARGAGKTSLFRLVNDATTAKKLRGLFETDLIPDALWFDAFSTHSQEHPEVGTLTSQAQQATDTALRVFWMTHLLRRLSMVAPEVVQIPETVRSTLAVPATDVAAWLPLAQAQVGAISTALDNADRALDAADRTVVATYDNLDLVGQFVPGVRRRYVATLLSLWLSLSGRYRRLRGKVFLRDDLFDAAELGFADASKLRSKSEKLDWEAPELFCVVLRHLANGSEGEAVRVWFSDVSGLELRDLGEFGWMPGEMPLSIQRAFATKLAGRVVGTGVLKAPTHEWLTSRLRDARGKITPRAMMWFLGFAAENAGKREERRARKALLTGDDLITALRRTSRERFQEIKEEYPFVVRIEGLRKMSVPIEAEVAAARVAVRQPGEPERIPVDGQIVLEEMVRVGALSRMGDGRIDVPDLYRYPLEIGPDYAAAWKDFLSGREKEAIAQFQRELPQFAEIFAKVVNWGDLRVDLYNKSELLPARQRIKQALKLAEEAKNFRHLSLGWYDLTRISIVESQLEQACEEAARAVDFARRQGDELVLCQCLGIRGLTLQVCGRNREAESDLLESISLARRVGSRHDHAWGLSVLCNLQYERGDDSRRVLATLREAFAVAFSGGEARLLLIVLGCGPTLSSILPLTMALRLVVLWWIIGNDDAMAHGRAETAMLEYATAAALSPETIESLKRQAAAAYEKDGGRQWIESILDEAESSLEAAGSALPESDQG